VVEPSQLAATIADHLATLPGSIRSLIRKDADLAVLSPHRTSEIFLIIREAIRNAAKHGNPGDITVTLETHGTTFVASVADDGIGFDVGRPPQGGSGITAMHERAALIDAELSITSTPGRTTVMLRVPLPH
jgi:signal transduction histidine kinase